MRAWILPLTFVVLWSTGYVAGPIALRSTEPFTMLALRFSGAAIGLTAIALLMRAQWPRSPRAFAHLAVAGLLAQAIQFGGFYYGVYLGAPANIAALFVGLMPIVTALGASRFLGERISRVQWSGFLAGFAGVALVVVPRLAPGAAHIPAAGLVAFTIGLLSISAGTLYQKRFCAAIDVRVTSAVQAIVAAIALLALARIFEPMHVALTASFAWSLAWMIGVNTIAASLIFFRMIASGEANRVASLFALVPPVSAMMTAIALHERFTPLSLIGFAVAAVGVALATRSASTRTVPQQPAKQTSAVSA